MNTNFESLPFQITLIMKQFILAGYMLLSMFPTFAQESSRLPLFRISDVQILTGSSSDKGINGSIGDFRKLAPGSLLLNTNLNDFRYSFDDGYAEGALTLLAGFQIRNKEGSAYRKAPMLRVGINYFSSNLMSESYSRQFRQRVDTLTSNQTGAEYYVDSVANHYLGMDYSSEHVRLDVSLLFHSNPAGRWSFFAGAGINAGMSFNAQTNVYYSEYGSVDGDLNTYNYSNTNNLFKAEKYANKLGFSGSFYLPLGVDFRIARKNDFFSKTHLFYEMRPSLNMYVIPELGSYFNTGNGHNLGFRYSW
jgi:hypothetical protein